MYNVNQKSVKYSSKCRTFLENLPKEQRKEIVEELENCKEPSGVIMLANTLIYRVKSKINIIFYEEIISVKKKNGKVILYGRDGILDEIVETKKYPVDIILQELKNKNSKIKRIRENNKKKTSPMHLLEKFHAGLSERQCEIFYMIYVLSDWIIWLILQMLIVFLSTYGIYGKEVIYILMIVVFITNMYLSRKTYDKFGVCTLNGLYYGMFIIKLVLCTCFIYILSL